MDEVKKSMSEWFNGLRAYHQSVLKESSSKYPCSLLHLIRIQRTVGHKLRSEHLKHPLKRVGTVHCTASHFYQN